MAIIDYNIAANGEVASPLNQLLQEIETIIVSDGDLITMPNSKLNLDQYLFRFGLSEQVIANRIQRVLDENLMNPEGYTISVSVQFLKGRHNKDTMLVNTDIFLHDALQQRLTYAVSP